MSSPAAKPVLTSREKVGLTLKRRYRAERRFRAYGLTAVLIGIMFVVFLFTSIIQKGYSAFEQTFVQLDINYTAEDLDINGTRAMEDLQGANYQVPLRASLRAAFPDISGRQELKKLYGFISGAAEQTLRDRVVANPALIGHHEKVWVLADDRIDMLAKGRVDRALPEAARAVVESRISRSRRRAA